MKMKSYKKSQQILLDTIIRKKKIYILPENLGMVVQTLGAPIGPTSGL